MMNSHLPVGQPFDSWDGGSFTPIFVDEKGNKTNGSGEYERIVVGKKAYYSITIDAVPDGARVTNLPFQPKDMEVTPKLDDKLAGLRSSIYTEIVARAINAASEWHERVYLKDKGARQSLMAAISKACDQGLDNVMIKEHALSSYLAYVHLLVESADSVANAVDILTKIRLGGYALNANNESDRGPNGDDYHFELSTTEALALITKCKHVEQQPRPDAMELVGKLREGTMLVSEIGGLHYIRFNIPDIKAAAMLALYGKQVLREQILDAYDEGYCDGEQNKDFNGGHYADTVAAVKANGVSKEANTDGDGLLADVKYKCDSVGEGEVLL